MDAGCSLHDAPKDANAFPPDDPRDRGRLLIAPEMLRSTKDFAALQGSKRTHGDELVGLRFRRTDLGGTRFGFATGRKLGGAVVRNRIRRRLRSILRALEPRLVGGWDVLISVRSAGGAASQRQLAASVEAALRAGGVLKGETTDR